MDKIYWSGHQCFGDCFCLCAAAHIKSLIDNSKIYVTFWEPFKDLASYFDNIEWIDPVEAKSNYKVVDTGKGPFNTENFPKKDGFYLNNGVSRFFKLMDMPNAYPVDIYMNIKRDEHPKYVSIVVKGGVNGFISKNTLETMILRTKSFYENPQFIFIGHFNNDISKYQDLQKKYNILDLRTDDRTGSVVMKQIQSSLIVMGPHTGLMYPALGLGCQVWCENSINLDHNFSLDFPSNRALFFPKT